MVYLIIGDPFINKCELGLSCCLFWFFRVMCLYINVDLECSIVCSVGYSIQHVWCGMHNVHARCEVEFI